VSSAQAAGAWLPEATDVRRATAAAVAAVALTGLAAVVVAIGYGASVRATWDFGFAGVPRTLSEAVSIFVNNARVMGAAGAAIVIVQSVRASGGGELGRAGLIVRGCCDALIAGAVVLNTGVAGAALGAYGDRMLVAMLPHAPFELVAYAFGIALYLRARVELLRVGCAARLAAWALGLLIVSAFVETYLHF
jgi:hypothetical protein